MQKTTERFAFVYPIGEEGEGSKSKFLHEVKQASPAFEEKIIFFPCDGHTQTIINNLTQISNIHTESDLLHLILSNEMPPAPYGEYMDNFYSLVPDKFNGAAFLHAYEYEWLKEFEIHKYIEPSVDEYYHSLENMVRSLFTA